MSYGGIWEQLGGAAGYASKQQAMQKAHSTASLKERLNTAVKHAEKRLAIVQEARDIFSKHPDIEKLLDILQKESL